MSVLCLICKDKLLSYSLVSSAGSLNQLAENCQKVIATKCGHLYHLECLQSWFRTQKLKKQTNPNWENNICPSCLSRVNEDENRQVFLFEDHLEALEKAKMLERQENLEIYCHQLETQLHQLQRENDIMLNKILTPPQSPLVGNYDTIVKNDRVVWVRKNEPQLTGIVLSIYKKEGQLCAKIKLDRKVKPSQRINKIFGSFRMEKRQEVVVPFDEIVLEKDLNHNSISRNDFTKNYGYMVKSYPSENSITSASSLYLGSHTEIPDNIRASTFSLPIDSNRRLFGIKESMDEFDGDGEHNHEFQHFQHQNKQPTTVPTLNRSISYSAGFDFMKTSDSNKDLSRGTSTQSMESSNPSFDQQRDYVMITPSWMKKQQESSERSLESRCSPPEQYKNKHVTFADPPKSNENADKGKVESINLSISSLSEQPYANLPSPTSPNSVPPKPKKRAPPLPPLNLIPVEPTPPPTYCSSTTESEGSFYAMSSTQSTPTQQIDDPISEVRLSVISRSNLPVKDFDFEDLELLEDFDDSSEVRLVPGTFEDANCFDITLLSLLYHSYGFDQLMILDTKDDSEFSRAVKWIIREKFVAPLRKTGTIQPDCSIRLKESLMHLCSGVLDVEELLTILFEFTYKVPPFINYSMEMCDYLHQFFIDFKDKSKIRNVQFLFEKSLMLQDNLQLQGYPEPALILQMPHSDGKIIHYDAVIPNLTMKIDHLIETRISMEPRSCYCESEATIECKLCSKIHGSSSILFCETCKPLLEEIHKENGHELQISRINAQKLLISSVLLSLSAIICCKNHSYSVFLKSGRDIYSPWVYVHGIRNGKLHMKQLPGFGYWLENLLDESKPLQLTEIPPLLTKVLKHSRVFIYLPVNSSECSEV